MAKKQAKIIKSSKKNSENRIKTEAQITEQLNLKILELLILNPSLTISELAKKIHKSESTTKRTLRKLQQLGHLKRIGPDKGGHWEVVNKEKNT